MIVVVVLLQRLRARWKTARAEVGAGARGVMVFTTGLGLLFLGIGTTTAINTAGGPTTTTTVTTIPATTTTTSFTPTGCPAPGSANNQFPCATQNGGQAGVPVGTVLTAYTGPTTITACNMTSGGANGIINGTIDGHLISAALTISLGNGNKGPYTDRATASAQACVRIINSKVTAPGLSGGQAAVFTNFNGAANCGGSGNACGPVFIANSELSMPQNPTTGANATFGTNYNNFQLWNDYVHGTTQGMGCDGWCSIHDSLMLANRGNSTNEAHMDPMIANSNSTVTGTGNPILMDHSTFFCGTTSASHLNSTENGAPTDCSGDIGLFGDACCGGGHGVNNVTITNSYMVCGSGCGNTVCWNFHIKDGPANSFNNMFLAHNVFDVDCASGANGYGTATRTGSIWCDNRYTNGTIQSLTFEQNNTPGPLLGTCT